MNSTIEFFTPQGDKKYKFFSARLPEFREAYPVEEYRIDVQVKSALDTMPKLFELYKDCLGAGLLPREAGLPSLPSSQSYIFEASLIHIESGCLVEKASAMRECIQLKDWEKGETSSRQRLIAAVGFGGEMFDEDEQSDMSDQGLPIKDQQGTPTAEHQEPIEPQPVVPVKAKTPPPVSEPVESIQNEKVETEQTAPTSVSSPTPTHEPLKAEASEVDAAEVSPAMKRIILQIEQIADVKGITVDRSRMTSVSDLKAYLKEMMKA